MVNYVLYLEFKPTIYICVYGQLCAVSRVNPTINIYVWSIMYCI